MNFVSRRIRIPMADPVFIKAKKLNTLDFVQVEVEENSIFCLDRNDQWIEIPLINFPLDLIQPSTEDEEAA